MTNSKTDQDYHDLAEIRNYSWLGPSVTKATMKTTWKCDKAHEWSTSYSSILGGSGCLECARTSKALKMALKLEDYLQIGLEAGIEWVGAVVPQNAKVPTQWRCSNKHDWAAPYSNLRAGNGCPFCARASAGAKQRLTPADYLKAAEDAEIFFLGPVPATALTKTWWRCANGHEWESSINWIKTGYLCKLCGIARNKVDSPMTERDFESISSKFAYSCVGELPTIKGANADWQCSKGHLFKTSASKIIRKFGCPECGITRQSKKRNRLVSDDYTELGRSREFCFLGPMPDNNQQKTGWKCKNGHEFSASYGKIQTGRGCPNCGRLSSIASRTHTDEDYERLAISRQFEWLRLPAPDNSKSKTGWLCSYGHSWLASYSKILNGRSCPTCSAERSAANSRLKEDAYFELAAKQNFLWEGPLPKNRHEKSTWRCKSGHLFEASFANVLAGRGCPVCGRESSSASLRLVDEDYEAFAKSRNWKWVGPTVANVVTKTNFQCDKGHAIFTALAWLKGGNGCPECSDMVNGVRVSSHQRALALILGGSLNIAVGRYCVDIALEFDTVRIAVEYDSWYYHGARSEFDRLRTKVLLESGWKVLRVRSNAKLPEEVELIKAVETLKTGSRKVTILTLSDWGRGPTFKNLIHSS